MYCLALFQLYHGCKVTGFCIGSQFMLAQFGLVCRLHFRPCYMLQQNTWRSILRWFGFGKVLACSKMNSVSKSRGNVAPSNTQIRTASGLSLCTCIVCGFNPAVRCQGLSAALRPSPHLLTDWHTQGLLILHPY